MAVLKDLIVHGRSRFVNGAQFNTINAESIGATEGVFNKLIATSLKADEATIDNLTAENAKITGILDVTEGELHTNTWTNASIATVGGSLYITPTLESASGNFAMNSATDITFSSPSTNFDWSNLYTGNSSGSANRSWTVGSKVLITGEVAGADGILLPLGTLKGDVVTVNTTTLRVNNLTDSHNHTSAILTSLWNSRGSTYANLKVSIYQWNDTSNSAKYPLGIYITALGTNGKTFLDIYGGYGNTYTTSYGGLALPNVRIGNLSGLPALTLPNNTSVTPQGWGIYTNNGFFTGTIVSTQGKIGNFTLSTAIYGASSGAGPNSINATTAGIYVGIDGIRSNKSGDTSKYVKIQDGILYAYGAEISGSVSATNGFTVATSTGTSLASMTGSGITLGQTSGGQYNVLVDNTGIKLRYNTGVLNLIDTSGMKLYLSSDTTNAVAQFGSTIQIGKTADAHINITSGGLDLYRGTTDLIAHLGYAGNNTTTPYLTFGRRDSSDTPGYYSAAFGVNARGGGDYSFVAGNGSVADGDYSHAEGYGNLALADYGFAIGDHNTINSHGSYSFVAGQNGQTDYPYNFLSGIGLIGHADYQTVFGKYNQEDSEAMFIIGNGDSNNARSNLMTIGNNLIQIGSSNSAKIYISDEEFYGTSTNGTEYFSINTTGGEAITYHRIPLSTNATSRTYDLSLQSIEEFTSLQDGYSFGIYTTFLENNSSAIHTYGISIFTKGETNTTSTHTQYIAPYTIRINFSGDSNYRSSSCTLRITIRDDHNPLYRFGNNVATTGGAYSFLMGKGTAASYEDQLVIGEYNIDYDQPFIVGNGTDDNNRSNAFAITWSGNILAQGLAGVIQMYAGTVPPMGWVFCDGQAYNREGYAALFAVIGTTYGAGDGSSTFNVPDLRGRAPIGAGQGSGLTNRTLGTQNIGSETVTLSVTQMPGHTHAASTSASFVRCTTANANMSKTTVASGSGKSNVVTSASAIGSGATTTSTGGGGAHENMQPSTVVNFIICTGNMH